ncbi:MAG: hypothetical protein EA412_06615, partial [Chitinophagaceae bacterium]
MVRCFTFILIVLITFANKQDLYGQSPFCDSITPHFIADLTGDPAGVYISPQVSRQGNCCGTSFPDRCVSFEVTLDSLAVGLHFGIASGAEPPGALYYQVDCGPQIPITEPICLTGGPHILTFCKPGANQNTYQITSIPGPVFPMEDTTRDGCTVDLEVTGFQENTITWTDITSPNQIYNQYLTCTSGCSQTTFIPDANAPAYVDYLVCGQIYGGVCSPAFPICDTVRVNVVNDLSVEITPNPAIFCPGASGVLLNSQIHGSDGNYTFFWRDSNGNLVGSDDTFLAPAPGIYTLEARDGFYPSCPPVFDTVIVHHHDPMTLSTQATPVSCFGYSDGSASVEVSGGTEPYAFIWNNDSNLSTDSIQNLQSGSYQVLVTDSFNCTVTATAVVQESSTPLTVSISSSNVSCFGEHDGQATVIASGGTAPYNFIWNGDSTMNAATATGLPAG